MHKMLTLFKAPEPKQQDHAERVKFGLTWNVCFMLFILIGIITVISGFSESKFFIHYLLVFLVSLLGMVFLKIYRNYYPVALAISLVSTVVILSSVLYIPNAIHIIESLWLFVIILFSYFALGFAWGLFFSVINAGLYIYYFNFLFFENLMNLEEFTPIFKVIISIEFSFSMFLIGFILTQYRKVNQFANEKRKTAYLALMSEKKLVDKQNLEKTTLLQEIHHRVKNNLQVIISLLRIQSEELKTAEAKNSFNEAISRIMTMSLIHQKMYENNSLSNINLEDYIKTLMNDIVKANYQKSKINLFFNIGFRDIGAKTIVPLGLIINELLSNSLEHAFEGEGAIYLTIKHTSNHSFSMHYEDNGTWKQPKGVSFGLQLIDIFTEQLEGKYERVIENNKTLYKFSLNFLD